MFWLSRLETTQAQLRHDDSDATTVIGVIPASQQLVDNVLASFIVLMHRSSD